MFLTGHCRSGIYLDSSTGRARYDFQIRSPRAGAPMCRILGHVFGLQSSRSAGEAIFHARKTELTRTSERRTCEFDPLCFALAIGKDDSTFGSAGQTTILIGDGSGEMDAISGGDVVCVIIESGSRSIDRSEHNEAVSARR